MVPYNSTNGRVQEFFGDGKNSTERAFQSWLASDPRARIGVAQSRYVFASPDANEKVMVTGGAEETFYKQLAYLEETGANLDCYSLDELDKIYVEARKEDQYRTIGLSLGLQFGTTLSSYF